MDSAAGGPLVPAEGWGATTANRPRWENPAGAWDGSQKVRPGGRLVSLMVTTAPPPCLRGRWAPGVR